MDNLSQTVLSYARCEGALTAGIATTDTLADGPPSTDLEYVLPGAKSAVVFSIALDQDLIPDYLGKVDRRRFENNYKMIDSIASGVGVKLANYLTQKGHPAVPLAANDVYRDDTPRGRTDMLPPISLRYLAVASGVGSFGLSGNVITQENGGGVLLGGIVTQADLTPTPSLTKQDNYCDDCGLCMASCASNLMKPKEKIKVSLGKQTFSYADRRSYLRCQYVCGGFTGLHPSGKWSTWSPGRFAIPDDDKDMRGLFISGIKAYNARPEGPGGYYHSLMKTKVYNTCANCQLICVPDKNERKRRYKLLTNNGVVVQHPDGRLEAMSSEDAARHLDGMDSKTRALYEDAT